MELKVIHPPTLRPQDWLRFAEVEPFPGLWSKLKLTDEDLQALQAAIVVSPKSGVVVSGTKGLRKLRFSTPDSSKGKSGSYRVFYAYYEEFGVVILWAILAKGQSSNLSKADRNAIGLQVGRFRRLLEQGVIR